MTITATRACYDAIADVYDSLHTSKEALDEDFAVMQALLRVPLPTEILDIGCGTGLLLDYIGDAVADREGYFGIDPSRGMLKKLTEKHPWARTQCVEFENYRTGRLFDLICGLYGSANYIPAAHLQRIPRMLAPDGRFFLMIGRPGYVPVTYGMTGVSFDRIEHPMDVLPAERHAIVGNYIIIEGGAAS